MAECSSTLNTVLGGAADSENLQGHREEGMWSQGQAEVSQWKALYGWNKDEYDGNNKDDMMVKVEYNKL